MEMVIAIGIFAVIATVGYASLTRFLDIYEHLSEKNTELRDLQLAFALLERDILYAALRPVRDEYGEAEAVLIAQPFSPAIPGELLRLTASSPDNSIPSLHRLSRVAWRLDDDKLYRATWKVLDRAADSPEYVRRVLDNVASLEIRFLTFDDQGALQTAFEWSGSEQLPAGIELLLTRTDNREYRRVFEVADAS